MLNACTGIKLHHDFLSFLSKKKNNGVDERFLDDNLYMCL